MTPKIEKLSLLGAIRRRGAAVALLLILLVPAACSGADSSGEGAAGMDVVEEEAARGRVTAASGSTSGGGSSGAGDGDFALGDDAPRPSSAARLPRFGPSVIKNATIDIGLPKDEVGDAMNEAVAIAGRHGGFVHSSSSGRSDTRGSLTMRVPSQKFEIALSELEDLGSVRSEHISGQDVSQDFVDLEARLRNWESQEAVLLRLMDRAQSVRDTIRVQSQLSRVQLEIEQIRGRLRFLRDQTSYGTITASFGPVAPTPSAPGRFARAWERAIDLMQGFVEAVIVASGIVLPLGLLLLIAYVIFRSVRPKLGT